MGKELEGAYGIKALEVLGIEMLPLCLAQMIAACMAEMGNKGD